MLEQLRTMMVLYWYSPTGGPSYRPTPGDRPYATLMLYGWARLSTAYARTLLMASPSGDPSLHAHERILLDDTRGLV